MENYEENAKAMRLMRYQEGLEYYSAMHDHEIFSFALASVFYMYISDKCVRAAVGSEEAHRVQPIEEYEKLWDEGRAEEILKARKLPALRPEETFDSLYNSANENHFQYSVLKRGFERIAETEGYGIIDGFLDFDAAFLGADEDEKNEKLGGVIQDLVSEFLRRTFNFDLHYFCAGQAERLLEGEAEYMGRRGNGFYTPGDVAELMRRLAASDAAPGKVSVFDPVMGAGGVAAGFTKFAGAALNKERTSRGEDFGLEGHGGDEAIYFAGQDADDRMCAAAFMNLVVHGIEPDKIKIKRGDSLQADWPSEGGVPELFDVVAFEEPFSQGWSRPRNRFERGGGRFFELAPPSRAEYAFIQHGYYHLKPGGTMAVIAPLGVLFRKWTEESIRAAFIEMNAVHAVIALPNNLFYNTPNPACLIIFKKERTEEDVLFIDAAKEFVKGKNRNSMSDSNLDRIEQIYRERKAAAGCSAVVSREAIRENGMSLSVRRYVESRTWESEGSAEDYLEEIGRCSREFDATFGELVCGMRMTAKDTSEEREVEAFEKAVNEGE